MATKSWKACSEFHRFTVNGEEWEVQAEQFADETRYRVRARGADGTYFLAEDANQPEGRIAYQYPTPTLVFTLDQLKEILPDEVYHTMEEVLDSHITQLVGNASLTSLASYTKMLSYDPENAQPDTGDKSWEARCAKGEHGKECGHQR